VTFIPGIFTPWAFVVGPILVALAAIKWFWPKPPHREELFVEAP
jgi:hypothetical protein